MKILLVSPEVVPFAKTGGLADVAGSLPKALKIIGHDVRIIMPRYKKVRCPMSRLRGMKIQVGDSFESVDVYEGRVPDTDIPVYFVDHEKYFGSREELYQKNGTDYSDNLERFALFSRTVPLFLKEIGWQPDIVHCNDWQSALVIAYLKLLYKDNPFFKRTATVYSVHNIGYLGSFPPDKLPLTGLGWDQFKPEALEFWGGIALAKAGFVYADVINTVSETYAREIQTAEYGHGLEGLLQYRGKDVYGIINGIDYDVWNPATDKSIKKRYSPATLSLKHDNKVELQKQNNLPQKVETPVIGMISRLADQKGFDILAGAIEKVMQNHCQLVILGTGDPKYHDLLAKEKQKYPDHIGVSLKFDAILAEQIYAGADMFLMPSLYEPCGLGQLISFKYGTIPIVRRTGGLADTVHEFDPKTGEGEGFVFEEYSSKALLGAIKRGCENFHKKSIWKPLQEKVMQLDYSWDASAKKYVSLYMKALAKIGIAAL
jgi:starch synthase